MASDNDNCVYLNEENAEVEYGQDMKQMLDIPEVEIDVADEPSDIHDEIEMKVPVVAEESIIITNSESEDSWDENKVKILLNMYIQNADKFRNPQVKKKMLWRKIGEAINKEADTCDKKFRNLKQHYVTILRKKRQFGRGAVRWPFFDLFEQIDNKVGFNLSDRVRYRPIVQKPDWDTPQFVVVGNSPNLKTPIIVNSVAPITNSLPVCANGDDAYTMNTGPQRKRPQGFAKISEELKTRQVSIEKKLDRLVQVVEESNNIQRERNKLFQEYLRKIHK